MLFEDVSSSEEINNLIRKADLQLLLDECIDKNFETEFEELAFTGKYVQGLKRVLEKGVEFNEIDSLDYVKKELADNLEKVSELIRKILHSSSGTTKKLFEETYLTLTQNCYKNLNELLSDLELVKRELGKLPPRRS